MNWAPHTSSSVIKHEQLKYRTFYPAKIWGETLQRGGCIP